ncbi:MAG: hypothetical protein ACRDID_15165 [Ktedonobacterales bacterium]
MRYVRQAQEQITMLTNRFKALEDVVAQLPPETQDTLAATLEDALRQMRQGEPIIAADDLAAAITRALERHGASLEYLKDK